MSTQITIANTNYIRGTRVVVRTSGGVLYAIVNDSNTPAIEVWKSSDGSSWTEQDVGDKPGFPVGAAAAAIDSSNVIHIVAWEQGGSASCKYTTFTTSDDNWSGTIDNIATELDGPVTPAVAISIDSNDKPHVVWSDRDTYHGTPYETIFYSNKTGASWRTAVEVEGFSSQVNCYVADITLSDEDYPEVVYHRSSVLRAALGNANDASSFTLHSPDTSITYGIGTYSTIAVDSAGNTWIGYEDSDGYINIVKHNDGAAWTSWQTPVETTDEGIGVSIIVDGTDVYVFYEDDNDDLVYNKYTGSWVGETTIETGTYAYIRARWAYNSNYSYASVGIDYLYESGGDIYWGRLVIAAPPTYVPQIMMVD